MFYSLTGKIVYSDISNVAIECSGIAFSLTCSANTLRSIGNVGSVATLYTYLSVKEDGVELFGFYDKEELSFFKMLIGVSGVGPKAAISVLSTLSPESLSFAIASDDVKSITRAQGVGPKSAQRIIIELKDKVAKNMPSEIKANSVGTNGTIRSGDIGEEAVNALMSLGYTRSEAAGAVCGCDTDKGVESIIKQALGKLMKG